MGVFVYILQSELSEIFYVGITQDLVRRLSEHNSGKSKFAKGHIPWKLVYHETYEDHATARVREKYLKSGAGRRWIKQGFSSW